MTQTLLGIIGHNISYTLSPAMHTEALRVLSYAATYGVFDVSSAMLPGLVAAMRRESVRGANVTIPHKQAVMPLLDELSAEAKALGAVNTIVNTGGVLRGENTDVDGVRASIAPYAEKIRGSGVLVLGAGGASRAVLYAAAELAPRTIHIVNRNGGRARALASAFQDLFPGTAFTSSSPQDDPSALVRAAGESALVVNTTSVGMKPDLAAMPVPAAARFSTHQIIFDIIYVPLQTALLRKAAENGATTIDGMEMFIQQGARSFTMWTGLPFPDAEARACVRHELSKRRVSQ